MSAEDNLRRALAHGHEKMGGHAFGVSAFAAMLDVGVGEAVSMLQAGQAEGWVDGEGGYYQLSEAGVAECVG